MLKITNRRPKSTFFETANISCWKGGKRRLVCVALEPGRILLKWKGTRQAFSLPYSQILDQAVLADRLLSKRRKEEERAKARGRAFVPRTSVVRRGMR